MRGQPDLTLKEWNLKAFKNPILGTLWMMFHGMLLWNLWKEQKNRIFKDKKHNEEEV